MSLFEPPNIEKFKAKRDVQGLIRALVYKDGFVRRNAAEAPGGIGGDRAGDALTDCLMNDQDAHVRARAAGSI